MPNANWSNPTLTSTYTNFVSEVKNRDEDLALQFDGTTSTNIPTGTIRWDSSANRWKKWTGSAWGELTSTYALTALTTTGSVGVGTSTAPGGLDARMWIDQAGTNDYGLLINASGGVKQPSLWFRDASSTLNGKIVGQVGLTLATGTGATAALTIDGSQRVGIGTTAPGSRLDVADGAGGTAFYDNIRISGSYGFGGSNAGGFSFYNNNPLYLAQLAGFYSGTEGFSQKAGYLAFATNSSTAYREVVRITSTGAVGIGTTSPGALADIRSITSPSVHISTLGYTPDYRGYTLDFSTSQQTAGINFATSSPSAFLDLYAGGSATNLGGWDGQIRFFTGATNSYGTERARIDSAGRLLVGTSTSTTVSSVGYVGKLQVANNGNAGIGLHGFYNGVPYGADIVFTKSNSNSIGTNTIVNSGDQLGAIWFAGANGTGYDRAAAILAEVDATPGASNDMPGRLVFSTTADGVGSPTERMRIDNAGNVGIGCTPTVRLDVVGNHRCSAASQPQLILNSTASGSWKSNIRFQNSGSAKYEIGVDTAAAGANNFYFYDAVAAANRLIVDAAGLLKFDSGYGSAATAYGCRAWVNFDGTTASPSTIRGSGNVSSVTKNATGDYTVNFTTAMVDANYTFNGTAGGTAAGSVIRTYEDGTARTTSAIRILVFASTTGGSLDMVQVNLAIFR